MKLSALKSVKTLKTEGKIKIFFRPTKAEIICHQQTNTSKMLKEALW